MQSLIVKRASGIFTILAALSLALTIFLSKSGKSELLYRLNANKSHDRSVDLFDQAASKVSDQEAMTLLLASANSAGAEADHWSKLEEVERLARLRLSYSLFSSCVILTIIAIALSVLRRVNNFRFRVTRANIY